MRHLGYTDNTIPGPHAAFRQQYRFPQRWSTPQGEHNPLRATRKGSGSQLDYIGYDGGPSGQPTQLKWLTGLSGLSGLGALRWARRPTTMGELVTRVRELIALLRADATRMVTTTDIHGETRILQASQFASWLESEIIGEISPGNYGEGIQQNAEAMHLIGLLDSVEQQVQPWYRKRVVGISIGGAIVAASTFAGAYHGYKRNRSIGWAAWWGLMGAVFPIITPAVALAQGFGKRKR